MIVGFDSAFQKSKIEIKDLELAFWLARGAQSPLALLLHGHTQSSEMWAPLANALHAAGMSVLALDLHGLGDSSGLVGRYNKKAMARDIRVLVDALGLVPTNTNIIGHDLGAFAAYAYAAQFARQGDKLVMMDATVPGLGIWPMLLQSAQTWHFGFYGRYAEAILEGRERIYLDRHWDEFAADAGAITKEMREFYASLYVRPGAVGRALSHFEAFEQDAQDNAEFAKQKLTIPVFGLGGEHSLGPMIADHVALLASNSQSEIIAGAGHWLLEENTEATIHAVREFLQ